MRRVEVSLFPFLSVLLCLFGSLALIVAGLGVDVLEQEPDRLKAIVTRLEDEARVHRLREEASAASAARLRRLVRVERDLTIYLGSLGDTGKEASALEALRRDIERLRAEIESKKRARTERQIAAQRSPETRLQMSGSGVNLSPTFIECDRKGIRIGAERREESDFIPAKKIKKSRRLRRYLKDAKSASKSLVIFMVRRGGIPNFEKALGRARDMKVRLGFLPVPPKTGSISYEAFR